MYLPPFCKAQNAGWWLKETLTNCPPSTPRILEESCEYSGGRPSQTNISLPAATKTAWAPSSWKGNGDDPTQPFTGHQRVSENEMSNCRRGAQNLCHTWGTIQKLAQNWQEWGTFVAALHVSKHDRHEWVSEFYMYNSTSVYVYQHVVIKIIPCCSKNIIKFLFQNFSLTKWPVNENWNREKIITQLYKQLCQEIYSDMIYY